MKITNTTTVALALLCLHTIAFAQNTNSPVQSAPTNSSTRFHA